MMQKISKLIGATFFGCLVALIGFNMQVKASDIDYVITEFYVYAQVHEDNSVDVDEYINVDFYSPAHGIYQSIYRPVKIKRDTSDLLDGSSEDLFTYYTKIKNIYVEEQNYEIERDGSTVSVKIGDPDRLVSGRQSYHVSYTCEFPDDRLTNSDFFFYSVLGSEWQTNVEYFNFVVKFDKELPESAINDFVMYTGEYGNTTAYEDLEWYIEPDCVWGDIYDLPAYNAITLFTNLPEGYFDDADKTVSQIPWIIFYVAFIALAILVIVKALGVHNEKPVVTVEFYPPEGISPAEVGTIIDETVDDSDIISLFPWWACKGYLRIKEEQKDGLFKDKVEVTLVKLKDLPADAPKYQRTVWNALFKNKDSVNMSRLAESKTVGEKMATAKSQLGSIYTGDKKLSQGHLATIGCSLLLSLLFGLMISFSSKVNLGYNFGQAIAACVMLLLFMVMRVLQRPKDNMRSAGSWVLTGIVGAIVYIIAFVAVWFSKGENSFLNGTTALIAYILYGISMFMAIRFIRDSEYKKSIYGKLMGLREFIKCAEMPKLEMLIEENPEYFYDVLPYAIAFGLDSKWAKKFENINMSKPDWYDPYDPFLYTPLHFHDSFCHGISAPISSAQATYAAANSSSSGGFSGGGGGGGGGGAW